MKNLVRVPTVLAILVIASLVALACAPAAAPTPTPITKAPAAPSPTAAPKTEAPKPAAASPTAPAKALVPYKVGVVLALSGGFTGLGIPSRDAAVALANEINAGGGINARRLELVIYDDGTDETKALLAVKKA